MRVYRVEMDTLFIHEVDVPSPPEFPFQDERGDSHFRTRQDATVWLADFLREGIRDLQRRLEELVGDVRGTRH